MSTFIDSSSAKRTIKRRVPGGSKPSLEPVAPKPRTSKAPSKALKKKTTRRAAQPSRTRGGKIRNPLARKNPWYAGTMVEDLLSIPKGTVVAFKRSAEDLSVGPTWWILSETSLIRVAESYGGESMRDLIHKVLRDPETGEFLEAPRAIHTNYNRLAANIQKAKQRARPRKDLTLKETAVRAAPL